MIREITGEYSQYLTQLESILIKMPSEDSLWEKQGRAGNSIGNIILHICGNLNHYIGHHLGNSGYIRDRDAEFSATGLSKEKLLAMIISTREMVQKVLPQVDESRLNDNYPQEINGQQFTVGFTIIHMFAHLAYHTGQADYYLKMMKS